MAETPRPLEWSKICAVGIGCLVLVLATGYAAFTTRPCPAGACPSFAAWFDQDTRPRTMLVGAAAGAAFGLIDNALLWLGMSALETLFRRLPGGTDPLVLAGYGNAFSSLVSAFVSTFVGRWISNVFDVDVDKAPLWSMALGIAIGCAVGIALPAALMRRAAKRA